MHTEVLPQTDYIIMYASLALLLVQLPIFKENLLVIAVLIRLNPHRPNMMENSECGYEDWEHFNLTYIILSLSTT